MIACDYFAYGIGETRCHNYCCDPTMLTRAQAELLIDMGCDHT